MQSKFRLVMPLMFLLVSPISGQAQALTPGLSNSQSDFVAFPASDSIEVMRRYLLFSALDKSHFDLLDAFNKQAIEIKDLNLSLTLSSNVMASQYALCDARVAAMRRTIGKTILTFSLSGIAVGAGLTLVAVGGVNNQVAPLVIGAGLAVGGTVVGIVVFLQK